MWLVVVSLSSPAHAYIYVGNPELTVRVARPAGDLTASSAHLARIREHKCGGGTVDVWIDETVDLRAGFTVSVPGGDLCGFSFDWDSAVVTSTSGWTVSYAESFTSVAMPDAPTGWTALTPFTVTAGSFSGDAPRLLVSVD
jgi:hypothetical protein